MSTFKPSKYQQAIYDFIANGNGNAVVGAVAGSGKSTTIVNALNIIPSHKTKVFLAFNKAIVEELKKKVTAPNTTVQTLHSAGFSAMMRTYKSKLDTYKYTNFLKDSLYLLSETVSVDTPNDEVSAFKSRVLKLLDLSRAGLLNNADDIVDCAMAHDIDLSGDEAEVVLKLMQWGIDQVTKIDFADMIWITVMKNLRVQTYDWVMVDECQDLSPMQNKLFQMMVEPKNGRFVAVGDRAQSIQYFAGAGNDSFDNIANLPNTIELPLSICYRCPKSVVAKAKELVPQIEAAEWAEEGIVETVLDLKKAKAGDMVLSRVTSELVKCCMKYIRAGIPAYVKGQDIGAGLKSIIKRSKKTNVTELFEFLQDELYKIQTSTAKRLNISMEEAKDDKRYIAFEDKCNTLSVIADGCEDTGAMVKKIDVLFKDSDKGICFSTIHKSKGLEADNVFIIALNKLPLQRAMKNPIQAQQEWNLYYVAVTRSKKALYMVAEETSKIKIQ